MIKKAIIPVAGLATRFLPASKVVPKTMFPILQKPIIEILVEEAVSAGIEEIAIVMSPRQHIIKEYFKADEFLEETLRGRGKTKESELVRKISEMAKIHFFIQEEALGDGHALLSTGDFITEEEACLVLFGDELIGNHNGPNAAEQLVSYYNEVQTPIVGVHVVDKSEVSRYGIIEVNKNMKIQSMIEKPSVEEAPSNLAIIGKYIINRNVLNSIKQSASGTVDNELRLIDGFKTYKKEASIHAVALDGQRFDTGNKLGLIKANIYFGLEDPVIKDDLLYFLRSIEK